MEILHTLESIRTTAGEAFFMAATYGADEILLLSLIMILYWCVDKKLAYRMVFGYMFSALAVNVIKLGCRIERPWVRDPALKPVGAAVKSATGYSFPSGHTQNAVSIYGTLAWRFGFGGKTVNATAPKTAAAEGTVQTHDVRRRSGVRWLAIPCLLFIPLIMFSRMYLGVHTLWDVLAGLLVSAVIVAAVNAVADRFVFDKRKRLIAAVCMFTAGTATAVYALTLYLSGSVPYSDVADICKGCGAGLAFAVCWYIETVYINFDEKASGIFGNVIKLVIGAGGALGIRSGIKAVFGANPVADMSRYFLMMVWALLVMPLIIKNFIRNTNKI